MFSNIKKQVFKANIKLVEYGLVVLTWGNASQITEDRRFVVIKPSGLDYSEMSADDMVVVDMEGNVIEGRLRPSSDLPTHLELYRSFENIGGVVHTHSKYAVALAQAEKTLPCYNTTHADSFHGEIPCTRQLTDDEISKDYEVYTGKVIVETIKGKNIDVNEIPAILVSKHGPFTWGESAQKAVENALVLEEVANMAFISTAFNQKIAPAPRYQIDKHYYRKHGVEAYYGQK